jgi:ATP-binding cassette subfamily C protein LapB
VVRDLRQATTGKTVIVATHRAPVLQLCDRVIWLDGGRVIADGPREDVLRKLSAA